MKGDAFIEAASVAGQAGCIDTLLPPGETLATVEYPFFDAIARAQEIASWREHLPSEDMPHRVIWFDDERLSDHFEDLRAVREGEKAGKTKWDDSNSKQNDAAKSLVVG